MEEDQELIDKVISIINANLDKVEYESGKDTGVKALSLILFKPVNEDNLQDYIYAYEIFVEITSKKAILQVLEKIFHGRDPTGKRWPVHATPVDLVVFDTSPAYQKFVEVFFQMEERERQEAENHREQVIKQLLNDEFTFDNPINTLIELSEKRVGGSAGTEARMQEPKIMFFGGEPDDVETKEPEK